MNWLRSPDDRFRASLYSPLLGLPFIACREWSLGLSTLQHISLLYSFRESNFHISSGRHRLDIARNRILRHGTAIFASTADGPGSADGNTAANPLLPEQDRLQEDKGG